MALYLSPDYQTSLESFGLSVQEKKFNIDFQDGHLLEFSIRAIFDLHVSLLLPTKFQVFRLEEEKNKFSRRRPS